MYLECPLERAVELTVALNPRGKAAVQQAVGTQQLFVPESVLGHTSVRQSSECPRMLFIHRNDEY